MGQLQELLTLLLPFSPSTDGMYTWRWSPAADGAFTVKNLSWMISSHIAESHNIATNWCKLVPRKVNVFIWRATRSWIPARAHLQDRGIHLDMLHCPLCTSQKETTNHILLGCNFSMEVWRCVSLWCNANIQQLLAAKDLLTLEYQNHPAAKEVWQGIAYIAAWSIWKARNGVVMQGI